MHMQSLSRRIGAAVAIPVPIKRAFLSWVAVFPTITVLLFLLQPLVDGWPLVARTLLLSAIMVPVLQFVVMPWLMRSLGFLVNNGEQQ